MSRANRLPAYHVARPDLVEELARAPVALLDAPGGYGKSALLAELADTLAGTTVESRLERPVPDAARLVALLRRACERSGATDLAAVLEEGDDAVAALLHAMDRSPEPVLLLVDDVHHARGEAAAVLAQLARDVRAPQRLVLAGRRFDGPLATLRRQPGVLVLDAGRLALDDGQVEALVARALGRPPARQEALVVVAAAGGWPAAAVLASTRLSRGGGVGDGSLPALLDGLLDPPARAVATAVAGLPLLDEEVVEAVAGRGAWRRLIEAGLPLAERGDGWSVLADPVREALAGGRPAAVAAGRAAEIYARRGELATALGLLASAGAHEAILGLLAASSWQDLVAAGFADVRAALSLAPAAARAAEPIAILAVARAAEAVSANELRTRLIDEGLRLAAAPHVERSFLAERALDLAREGRDDEACAAARAALAGDSAEEPSTRVRALLALGRAEAFRATPASLEAAREHLEECAALCAAAREREWRAKALLALGYRVSFARGDVEAAIAHLTAALAGLPAPRRERAEAAVFLADLLVSLARPEEAEARLRDGASIARLLGDERLRGYAAWTGAKLAALRGDDPGCREGLAEAELHPGDWFEHPTGIEFLAEAAELMARAGDEGSARAYLERARSRADGIGYPEIAWRAEGVVEARFGDPAAAERWLVAYVASPQMSSRERWHLLLLRAYAALRAGDRARARSLATAASTAASELGVPALPHLLEPDLVDALRPAEPGHGERRDVVDPAPVLAVTLLGGFAVTADARPLEVPPGHGALLVKLCSLAERPLATGEVIDLLWPGADPTTSRRRLRNLLGRLRERCGDLIERDGESLRLAADVAVDAVTFERAALRALTAAEADRPGLARGAIAGYTGELLPADRFDAWAAAPRERLARRWLDLLDLLAEDAREREDVDEAIRLLERAIAAEPLDESRYVACAGLLLLQGRRGTALTLAERAASVRAELGLPLSARLERLLAAAGGSGGRTLDGRPPGTFAV